ncbi:MAG: hypothetical protein HF982_03860 [Desulfobacteraceae bacterium]|nr:hypothetical protein [Desulfobacteraceae bacterium]MBC2718720.1 hypothetical protein [Desulfobacteraceae bacterium]
MKIKKISLIINAGIVLLVGLAIVLSAPIGSFAADDKIISSLSPDGKWEAKNTVWTSHRKKNALPCPMPMLEGTPAKVAAPAEPVGAPGLIPSGAAGQEYSLQDVKENTKTLPLGYPYPPPYTRYENFNGESAAPYDKYKAFPYRTVGVLFFTQNGTDYRCTASSIGNYAIWTAGHCVSDGAGNWSTDFLFIPAYKDGNPAVSWAQWTGANAWVMSDWHNYGDLCRDMGGVVMNLNTTGKKVSYVGWLGFAYNLESDQHWHGIGYPAASPFDGNKQIICASSHSSDDDPCVLPNPSTIGTGCDQTGGCSGGPWIKDFSGEIGECNFLNGNFSYFYLGYPDEIFSPYFDIGAHELYEALVNDTP